MSYAQKNGVYNKLYVDFTNPTGRGVYTIETLEQVLHENIGGMFAEIGVTY